MISKQRYAYNKVERKGGKLFRWNRFVRLVYQKWGTLTYHTKIVSRLHRWCTEKKEGEGGRKKRYWNSTGKGSRVAHERMKLFAYRWIFLDTIVCIVQSESDTGRGEGRGSRGCRKRQTLAFVTRCIFDRNFRNARTICGPILTR